MSAETAATYTKYCPDPTDIFTGIAHETEYTPKITVDVDPKFNDKMKAERSMGDLPLTPVYDLVVTVVPTINEYCLPQYDETGRKITSVDPPLTLPFKANFIIGESPITKEGITFAIGPGTFTRAGKDETGAWKYEWKVAGWPNGITNEAQMLRLFKAMAPNSGEQINVRMEIVRPNKQTTFEIAGVPFQGCSLSAAGPIPWGRKKIVAVGGLSEPARIGILRWIKGVDPNASTISSTGSMSASTQRLKDEINLQLERGYHVLVAGHSQGAAKAFNMRNDFPGKCGDFLFIDPPYKAFICRVPGLNKISFVEEVNKAICDGIGDKDGSGTLKDPRVISWTDGKGFLYFFRHAAFMLPWYRNNEATLEKLKTVMKDWQSGKTKWNPNKVSKGTLQIKDVLPATVLLGEKLAQAGGGQTVAQNNASAPTPVITKLSSPKGSAGSSLKISGRNFGTVATVYFENEEGGFAWQEGLPVKKEDGLDTVTYTIPSQMQAVDVVTLDAIVTKPVSVGSYSVSLSGSNENASGSELVDFEVISGNSLSVRKSVGTGASSSGTRYGTAEDCKQNVQAKATFQYPTGVEKDSLKIIVDPAFNDKMKAERFTTDLPVTPVYDLIVQGVPTYGTCYTATPEKFATEPSKTLPFKVSIVANNETIVGPGGFVLSDRKDDKGGLLYEWKVPGWKDGIAKGDKLEKLIKAIQEKKSVKIVVDDIKQNDGTSEKEEAETSFGLCAPIWGSGEHKIVGMYDEGKGVSKVVDYFDMVRRIGFAKIEPYASNQSFFSYFADLKKVSEGTTKPITQIALEVKKMGLRAPTIALQNNVLEKYINESSCKDGIYLLKVNSANNSLPWGVGGVALMGASIRGALIDTEGAELVAGSRGASSVGIVYVHEFSHTFAQLNDEYVYRAQSVNVGLPLHNCSVRPPADFSVNGKIYGSTKYQGCSFQYDAGERTSVPSARYYRPSNMSVMNKDGEEFNVVSCGWILAAIKGGDAKSYFPECAAMNGVVKDGVGQSASVWNGSSTLLSVFGAATDSLTAEAGAALQFKAGTSVKVILPENRKPPAGFVALAKGEKTAKPEFCLDATGRQAFTDNPQPFLKNWTNQALCAQNIAWATWMGQIVADSEAAFASLEAFKVSVEMTKKSLLLDTNVSTRQIKLVAVPVGGLIERKSQMVTNITLQCIAGSSHPVGTSSIYEGIQLVAVTAEQAKLMAELKKQAKTLSDDYTKIADDVEGHGGKNTLTTPTRTLIFANNIKGLFKNMKNGFVLLSPEAVAKNHPALKAQDIFPISFTFTPKTPCALPSLPGIMKTFGDLDKDTKFTSVTATFDGNTIAGLCVPADNLSDEFANAVDVMKIPSPFGTNPDDVKKLNDLRVSWYGCYPDDTAPSAQTASTKIVRKSLIPQSPPSVNGADTSSEPSGETDTSASSPSYLIVESFDPADPWGEIVQVVRDSQTPFIGSGNVGAPGQLQELGLYSDKLAKLKKSIDDAIEVYTQKKAAFTKGKKGGELLQGDPKIDGPLYLLQKMIKNLETNADGSLKDPAGLIRFFANLKALKSYSDSSLSDVFKGAQNFVGFSFLLPPSSDKPLLVFVPGSGGEPLFKSAKLFEEASKKFNIVGYTYDPTRPFDQIVDTFKTEFAKNSFKNQEHLLMTYSMGNNVILASIIGTPQGDTTFSNSNLLSVAYLPGGSAKALKPFNKYFLAPLLLPLYMPGYREVVNTLSPGNPGQSTIANSLFDVGRITKGAFFIQGNGDPHINGKSPNPIYAPNRDRAIEYMNQLNVMYVTPPNTLEKDNPHVNVLAAPELKEKIGAYGDLLAPRKPGATAKRSLAVTPKGIHSGFTIVGGNVSALATVVASAVTTSEDTITDVINMLLPGAVQSECTWLTEALQDGMMIQGTDYTALSNNVKEYLSLTKPPCTFDEIEKNAKADLKKMGFEVLMANSVTLSVDGATDAVGVAKGEEAEVKWKGAPSIVSCRGSWNPTEKFAASGTVSVTVNENSTVSISCLDADKSVVTASVIVSAVNPPIFFESVRRFFAPESTTVTTPTTKTDSSVSPISALTEQITNLSKNAKLSSTGSSAPDPLLASLVGERKKVLLELAKTNPEAFLAAMMSDAARKSVPQSLQKDVEVDATLTGTLEVYHADDFAHPEKSRYFYFLNTTGGGSPSGKVSLKSVIPGAPSSNGRIELYPTEAVSFVSGTRIRIRGYQIENILVSRVGKTNLQTLSEAPRVLDAVGEQKMLVLLLQFTDSPVKPFTATEAKDIFINGRTNDFYKEQSYGKAYFSGDLHGWIDLTRASNDCSSVDVSDPTITKYLINNRIDLGKYDRLVFAINSSCSRFGGYSSVGRWGVAFNGQNYNLSYALIAELSSFKNMDSGSVPFSRVDFILSHELGHSLGLSHAYGLDCNDEILHGDCKRVDYGNVFDALGNQHYTLHFNAYNKQFLNWITPQETLTIEKSGRYTLNPLENKNSAIKLAEIKTKSGIIPFILEYRQPIGFDANLNADSVKSNQLGLLVNAIFPNSPQPTYLLDMSPGGTKWETPDGKLYPSSWSSRATQSSLNGSQIFSDPDTGVILGPIVNNDTKGIMFDVGLVEPQCVLHPPLILYASTPKLVNAGGYLGFTFRLKNQDSFACIGKTKFNFKVIGLPTDWAIEASLGENPVEGVAPEEVFAYAIGFRVPSGTKGGEYNFVISAIRESDGTRVDNKFSFVVDPPLSLSGIFPQEAKVGETVVITGTGFPKFALTYLFFDHADGTRLLKLESKNGTSLSFVIPDSLSGFCRSTSCPVVPPVVPVVAGSYTISVQTDSSQATLPFIVSPSSLLNIEGVRPSSVQIGKELVLFGHGFNAGSSVIEVRSLTSPSSVVLETIQERNIGKNNKGDQLVTMIIPELSPNGKALVPGKYSLYVVDMHSGEESNKVFFEILPPVGGVKAVPIAKLATPYIRVSRGGEFNYPELPIGSLPQGLASFDVIASEAVRLSRLEFRISVTGNSSALSGMNSFGLYRLNPPVYIGDGKFGINRESVVFSNSIDIDAGGTTFAIGAIPGSKFSPGQKLTLSANFYKDDIEATSKADPKRYLNFSKSEVMINTLTAVLPNQGVKAPAQGNLPAEVLRAPAKVDKNGVNLSATKPTISGSSAGEGKLYAGEMTLKASVMSEGLEVVQTFNNSLQYRDAGGSGAWVDWMRFEVPDLAGKENADVTYRWSGGAGDWEFRLVADSGGEIAEANEQDNYSPPMRVFIVAREGDTSLPPAIGTAHIVSGKPVIQGTSDGLGKLRAGAMTFADKVINTGEGTSRAFKALLQYSKDGAHWSDWVQIDISPLGPGNSSDISYSWSGSEGVWFFRTCDDVTDTCSASTKVEIVSI